MPKLHTSHREVYLPERTEIDIKQRTPTSICQLILHKYRNGHKISTSPIKMPKLHTPPYLKLSIKEYNIVAAFLGMHVSPAKHNYAWLQESVTTGQTHGRTDGKTPDKVIPMCHYASQATQHGAIKSNAWQSDRRTSKWSSCGVLLCWGHKFYKELGGKTLGSTIIITYSFSYFVKHTCKMFTVHSRTFQVLSLTIQKCLRSCPLDRNLF